MTEIIERRPSRLVKEYDGAVYLSGTLYRILVETINIDRIQSGDVVLYFDETGMEMWLRNRRNISLVNLRIDKSAFLEYWVKTPSRVALSDVDIRRQVFTDNDEIILSWTGERRYEDTNLFVRTVAVCVVSSDRGSESYYEQIIPLNEFNQHKLSSGSSPNPRLTDSYGEDQDLCKVRVTATDLLRELRTFEYPFYTGGALFVASDSENLQIYCRDESECKEWVRRTEIFTHYSISKTSGLIQTEIDPFRIIEALSVWDDGKTALCLSIKEDYPILFELKSKELFGTGYWRMYIAPQVSSFKIGGV